jgi:hypothetical protein
MTISAEGNAPMFEVRALDGWGMTTIERLSSPKRVALKLAEFEYYGCFTDITVRRISDCQLVELGYFTFH